MNAIVYVSYNDDVTSYAEVGLLKPVFSFQFLIVVLNIKKNENFGISMIQLLNRFFQHVGVFAIFQALGFRIDSEPGSHMQLFFFQHTALECQWQNEDS